MRDENERAFAKARVAEQETVSARGQAALAKHLSTAAASMTVTGLDEDQKSQLAQRISGTGSRISAIALVGALQTPSSPPLRKGGWSEPRGSTGSRA